MKQIKYFILSIIILLILGFVYLFTLQEAEPKLYDFMTRNILVENFGFDGIKNVKGHDDIILVMVDDKSTEKYRWPWKREIYAEAFEYILKYGKPKVLIHDALIVTPDSTNPESDRKFFDTIKKYDNFVSGFFPKIKNYENLKTGEIYDKKFIDRYSINAKANFDTPRLYNSLLPYPESFLKSLNHAGSVAMMQGDIWGTIGVGDEVYRFQEPVLNYKGKYFPSLPFAAFLIANNNPEIILNKNYVEIPELNRKIPLVTSEYQMVIPVKFYKTLSNGYIHNTYSAIDVIESSVNFKKGKNVKISPEIFRDKYVIFGANVTAGDGLNDTKNTPVASNFSGADFQATALDNIVHDDFLKVIPYGLNLFITLLGMFLIYLIIRVNNLFKSITYSLGFLIGYILISIICFYFCVIINVVTPIVMFVITMIFGYTHKFILENKSKEKVKSAMGKYMSEDVMKRVIQNIDNLGLGGKKATVTVLFADIRGFTSLSERLTAQEVSEILNEYFTEIEPIITKYNGIINKFIGDAVMAIFGEPIQDKNHPSNAVKCGYEMLQKVDELRRKWTEEGKPTIEIGIGINTGDVFVGNIGSANRMEYTVIGDTVNLASRLESYNKVYKTKMLISSSTYAETKAIVDVIKISDVEIRGKANKMDIYEVLKIV